MRNFYLRLGIYENSLILIFLYLEIQSDCA